MRSSARISSVAFVTILFLSLCVLGQSWGQTAVPQSDPATAEDAALKELIPADSVTTLIMRDSVMQALENNLDSNSVQSKLDEVMQIASEIEKLSRPLSK